jgi:DNA (cytosine-5)-methyltransferase 1
LTHGSLFSGIGGFDLAAQECGIENRWCCEIEQHARRVLIARFPEIPHYTDVTTLNGAEIEPVDIVTFGSPCQSFSVGGKRTGLNGTSGLFFHATRIIREMRVATNGKYPKYAVMENVPGIFSSKSKVETEDGTIVEIFDFQEVLNEFCRIGGETIDVPRPEKGRFFHAGSILGDGYSIAWRTIDARYFGVPQKRKRMYCCVDFRGGSAPRVLAEQTGKRRCFTPSYLPRSAYIGSIAERFGELNIAFINANSASGQCAGSRTCVGIKEDAKVAASVTTTHVNAVCYPCVFGTLCGSGAGMDRTMGQAGEVNQIAVHCLDYASFNQGKNATYKPQITENLTSTIIARGASAVAYPDGMSYIIRRITPMEGLRLQGFPDWWLDGLDMKNTNKYKKIGNAIAVPCGIYVLRGILEEDDD